MSKLRFRYDRLVDAVSGGGVYQSRWMSGLGIPPVSAWTVRNPTDTSRDHFAVGLGAGASDRGSPTRWSQPAAKDPAGIENTERCLDRRERPCPVAGSSAGCTRALNRLSPLCFGRA
jgi:hypothetical protein